MSSFVAFSRYRRDDKLSTESVLVFRRISFFAVIRIIHRLAESAPFGRSKIVYRIQIRYKFVSESEIFCRDSFSLLTRFPRFFAHKLVAGRMQSVYRTEHAVLKPSEIEFVILISSVMTAYIVAPPGIADVGRRRSHIRLEIQSTPGHSAVSAETYRIPVASYARITRQYHRALTFVRHIESMIMI